MVAGIVLVAWRPNTTAVLVNAPSSVDMGGESVAHKSDRMLPVVLPVQKPNPHKHKAGPPLVIVPSYYRKN